MNRPYKSIWNASLGACGAAFEPTSARGKKAKKSRSMAAAGVLLLAFFGQMSESQAAGLISPCTGASLPRSAITGLLNPVVDPLTTAVDGLTLGVLGLNGIWTNLAAGNPISLNVLDTQGNVLSTNQDCNVVAHEYSLSAPAGVSIGGNKITGLGTDGGTSAVANELTSVAIGNGASTAVGAANALALGENANVSATALNSVALGANSVANAVNTVSVGQAGAERRIVNVANGVANTDAATIGQLSTVSGLAANSVQYDNPGKTSVTLGGAGGTTIGNVKAGEVSATSTQAVNGAQLSATNAAIGSVDARITNISGDTSTGFTVTNGNGIRHARTNETGLPQLDARAQATGATAVGYNATASAENSVAIGRDSNASAANSVALGAGAVAARGTQTGYVAAGLGTAQNSAGEVSVGNVGSERQLTNVAPGSAGTDAVNVNQLNGVTGGISNYVNNAVRRIDDVERNADAGTAGAMAMAGMPQAFTPGKNMLAAGAATYQGQTSLAIGLSRLSDNGKWVMKFNGAANSRGKLGLAVGAGYQW